jgi:S-DNA-T family DNA segregation ATPase FtsK/SpoIIIE
VPERCDECGYEYERDAGDALMGVLRADAEHWHARLVELDDAALRRRAAPYVWSPLEYACHVRDVLRVQRERVDLALTTDTPEFVPMRRDERVVEERYNEQAPADVSRDLVAAADAFATQLELLDDAGWARTGIYSFPTRQLRTVEWIARHTVHELEHHLRDIDPDPTQ